MTCAEADLNILIDSVVAAFQDSAKVLQKIVAANARCLKASAQLKKEKELLAELQHGAQHIERANVSGHLNMGESYGLGHDGTKFELARVIDAMNWQISKPLKQLEQGHLEQYDAAHMLDIVLAYKQVVLDILEQLRQSPSSTTAQSDSTISPTPSMKPKEYNKRTRARIDSVQQDNETQKTPPHIIASPTIAVEDFSDNLPVRTISRATTASLSADSNGTESRRPSAASTAPTAITTNTTSPTTTINALSARLHSRNTTPARSRSASRRANAPDPVIIPTAASIGASLHQSTTMPTAGPARPAPIKRNHSALGNTSGALLAGMFLPPEPSQSLLHHGHAHYHSNSNTHTEPHDPHAPSKQNHYHGLCKGAWTARSDPKRAFATHALPVGMYGRKEQWRCKECHFSGSVVGTGKHKSFDDRVFVDAATGIQFKWMFLAKSHVRLKEGHGHHHSHGHGHGHGHGHQSRGFPGGHPPSSFHTDATAAAATAAAAGGAGTAGPTFGCIECVDEEQTTAVYNDAHALLAHIAEAHPEGVRAAVKPPDPFWQGAIIAAEGDWDLYMPQYADATTPLSPPLTWH